LSAEQHQPEQNPFDAFRERYYWRPGLMVREVWAVTPDKWQDDVMHDVAMGERKISIRSGHGVGKTTTLAWLIIWFILTRYPQRTVCTAPTSSQLFDALAAEVKRWIGLLPENLRALLDVKTDHITLAYDPAGSFISFRTSRPETPEAMAGVHAENVLLVVDEASGVPEQVFEAGAGSMSGENATTILAGNPVRTSGTFYDSHHRLRDSWKTYHVSCVDSPRVTPKFIEEMKEKYGEDSNAYRVRVLGEFPKGDDDTVIPMELAESALLRDVQPIFVAPVWGLDCARFGSDRTALTKRRGNVLQERTKFWRGLDTMQIVGAVVNEWEITPFQDRPVDICVDSIGIGAGVVDRLRELGLPARGINVSESPAFGNRFANLRAELLFKARDWFAARDVNIAGDAELAAELTDIRYKFRSNGKIQIESKDDIRKRGKRSPDLADSFVLTFASDPITAQSGGTSNWSKPLKRIIKGIV